MPDVPDSLEGVHSTTFAHDGKERTVYRLGDGPGVVIIAEVPGIHPGVADFARRVADAGFTSVVPDLFGVPGGAPSLRATLQMLPAACVSREFVTTLTGRTSPVTVWLRALARSVHAELGGPGVGALGMCFTGGFALAMMVDDSVVAPVLSQPSLPFPISRAHKRDLNLNADDLARVKERAEAGVCVLGLRFTADRLAPRERFERLREEFGNAFIAVEIDSSPGNAYGFSRAAHSVLTHEFVDELGHPTRDALDQVLAFFRERLRP